MIMPYQNEIIFLAGYGIICCLVILIYVTLAAFIIFAVNVANEKVIAFGLLARNIRAVKVIKRINYRKRFLKNGKSRPVVVRPCK